MYIEMALFVFSVAIIVGLLILACVRDDMDSGARMIYKNEEEEKKNRFFISYFGAFFYFIFSKHDDCFGGTYFLKK